LLTTDADIDTGSSSAVSVAIPHSTNNEYIAVQRGCLVIIMSTNALVFFRRGMLLLMLLRVVPRSSDVCCSVSIFLAVLIVWAALLLRARFFLC
jgi:hypothetical protein